MAKHKVEITGVSTNELEVLSNEEMKSLFEKCKNGDKIARERLISGNLKLVLSILKRFNNRGENMDDLFQVGCIGLVKAIDNFDLTQEVRLSTYAAFWIRQSILDALYKTSALIYLPRSVREKRKEIFNIMNMLTLLYKKEVCVEQVAEYLNMEVSEIEDYMAYTIQPLPLDEAIWRVYSRESRSEKVEELVEALLTTLPYLERKIIRMRFGIGYEEAIPLEEIGRNCHISYERARQLEKRAMNKLLHPARKRGLKGIWKM